MPKGRLALKKFFLVLVGFMLLFSFSAHSEVPLASQLGSQKKYNDNHYRQRRACEHPYSSGEQCAKIDPPNYFNYCECCPGGSTATHRRPGPGPNVLICD